MMRKTILPLLLLLPALGAGAQVKDSHNFEVAKQLETLNAIYKSLDMMYVDSINPSDVIGTGIKAMLKSLDPYTEYYPEEKTKNLKEIYTGKFAGIGALIRYNLQLKRVVIDEPYEGMPAAEAGLRKGDIILSIDDEPMEDQNVSYVSQHLRGDPGTSFMLKIKRPSTGKKMQIKITRRVVQMPSVPFYGLRSGGTGYIHLSQFTEGCAKEVRKAFIEMKEQGMKQLVLDLRDNGGGSEQEAVDIVNIFVPKNKLIVSNRGKLQRANRDYLTKVEPLDTVMPVVVLVNDGTASASEITSGALQDLDRAVVMGTRTYGKGLVQMSVDLPYNGNLKLTTNKYYIPSGRCIQAINYLHSQGGYTEHVPDSLTKVFHTAGGREVRDGGGITPDVVIEADSLPNITIAPAADFALTDQDYQDFKQRVMKSGFSYDNESERYLKQLVKIAQFEGYYNDAKDAFDQLESKLKHNLEKDLNFNKDQLKKIIEGDIVAAYYYEKGAIENSLRGDRQMDEALKLLSDPERYRSLLTPQQK